MSYASLVRLDPLADFANLHDRVNRYLGEALPRFQFAGSPAPWLPPVDIFEVGDRLILRAEIPGVERDDLDIKIESGILTIRGEKKIEKEVDAENAHRLERFFGSFSRSFALPATVDAGAIRATYRDGVLEVVLPKAEEAKPKKIAIQAS